MSLHSNIKAIRESKKISTANIAKKLKMFEIKYIELEKGMYKPNSGLLHKIANIFNMTINEIENYNTLDSIQMQSKLDLKNLNFQQPLDLKTELYEGIPSITKFAITETIKKDIILRKPKLIAGETIILQDEILNTDLEKLELPEENPYDGYKLTDNTIAPRLINHVEKYKYKGEFKTMFYTEVNSNMKVGDRVFIINGNYDSDLLIKINKYKKYRDGYRVIYVDNCKIALDINYDENNIIKPYNDDNIDDFIHVYTIENDNDFLMYNRWITSRGASQSGDILDYKFSKNQNMIAYSKINTHTFTTPYWGSATPITSNGFYVREYNTTSQLDTWEDITTDIEIGSFGSSYNSNFNPNDRLYIHGHFTHSFNGEVVEFNDGDIYMWDNNEQKWVIDIKYYIPILTKSNFRDGLFTGEFNSGLYGRSDKRIEWNDAKWNLGTLLNTKWIKGEMKSIFTLRESYTAEKNNDGVLQKTSLPNNNGWGYNYIYDSKIDEIKIGGANINDSIIGATSSHSIVYDYLSKSITATYSSHKFDITKALVRTSELNNGKIKTSDIVDSYSDNILISESKTIDTHINRSVMKDSKYMTKDDIIILDYEIMDSIGMSASEFIGYKFYISENSYNKLKKDDTFYIKDLNIEHNYPMNFFDKKFKISSKTNYIDYLDGTQFVKEGIEYIAHLSTPKDNKFEYELEITGTKAGVERSNKEYSLDIIFYTLRSNGMTFSYDIPLSELSKGQFNDPHIKLDISNAYISKGDFESGYMFETEWINGNHIEDNNDVNMVSVNNNNGTYSISIDTVNDYLIVNTNLDINSLSGETCLIKEDDIVYLNNISYVLNNIETPLNDTYRVVNDDYNSTGVLTLEEISTNQIINTITPGGVFESTETNNRYGYIHKLKIDNSKLIEGIFRRTYICNTLIENDDIDVLDKTFKDIPNKRKLIIADSLFKNTNNTLSKALYMYSSFVYDIDSERDLFMDGIVYRSQWNGLAFNNGLFKKSTWRNGVFNNGMFYENNDFVLYSGVYNDNMRNSYYINGTISGTISNDRYSWRDGEFKKGEFYKSNWEDGVFHLGKFYYSDFYKGTIENGIFGDINIPNDKTRVFNSVVKKVVVENANFIADRVNMKQTTANIIQWKDGVFNNGIFSANAYSGSTQSNNTVSHSAIWEKGKFNGGIFGGNALWKNGTFNGGRFESIYKYNNSLGIIGTFIFDSVEVTAGNIKLTSSNNYEHPFNNTDSIVIELDSFYNDPLKDNLNGVYVNSSTISTVINIPNVMSIATFSSNDISGVVSLVNYTLPSNNTEYAWIDGVFNGGEFGNGKVINSTWFNGEFNGGEFRGKLWNDGVFSYGKFHGSGGGLTPSGGVDLHNVTMSNAYTFKENYNELYYGLWIDGTVTNKKDTAIKDKAFYTDIQRFNHVETEKRAEFHNMLWEAGTFSHSAGFFNKSVWLTGTFENGTFENSSFNPFVKRNGFSSFDTSTNTKWINGLLKKSDFYISEWKNGVFDEGNTYGMIWRDGITNYMNAYNIYWENGIWKNGNWYGSPIPFDGDIAVDSFYDIILKNVESKTRTFTPGYKPKYHVWNLFTDDTNSTKPFFEREHNNFTIKRPTPGSSFLTNSDNWYENTTNAPYFWMLNNTNSLYRNPFFNSNIKNTIDYNYSIITQIIPVFLIEYKEFTADDYYFTWDIDNLNLPGVGGLFGGTPVNTEFDIELPMGTYNINVNFQYPVNTPVVPSRFRLLIKDNLSTTYNNINILSLSARGDNTNGVIFKDFKFNQMKWEFKLSLITQPQPPMIFPVITVIDYFSKMIYLDDPMNPEFNTTGWSYDPSNNSINCLILTHDIYKQHTVYSTNGFSNQPLSLPAPFNAQMRMFAYVQLTTSDVAFDYEISASGYTGNNSAIFDVYVAESVTQPFTNANSINLNASAPLPIQNLTSIVLNGPTSSGQFATSDISIPPGSSRYLVIAYNNGLGYNFTNTAFYLSITNISLGDDYHDLNNTIQEYNIPDYKLPVHNDPYKYHTKPLTPINTLVGNGKFRAGIWEDGVWNSGYRNDEMSELFYDVEPFNTYRVESDVKWKVRVIGEKTSVMKFKIGDDISIANIIGININDDRKILKDSYKVIDLKEELPNDNTKGYIDIFIETTFPLMRIEKDSVHHRIKITKNIWLSGLLNNGLWENGVWNNGVVRGFPRITEMFDNHWIDGVFNGGHFKNKDTAQLVNIDKLYETLNGKIGVKFNTHHGLYDGDIVHIENSSPLIETEDYEVIYIDALNIEFDIPYVTLNNTTTLTPIIHSAVIQNMEFYDNNIAEKEYTYQFNSWMDIQFYKESAVNILKDETSKIYHPLTIPLTKNTPNLYGFPTLDVLSSVSEMTDSYRKGKTRYRLGTKYKEYYDFIGDASKFEDYFDVNENEQEFIDLGWTYSRTETVWRFDDYEFYNGGVILTTKNKSNIKHNFPMTPTAVTIKLDNFYNIPLIDGLNGDFNIQAIGDYEVEIVGVGFPGSGPLTPGVVTPKPEYLFTPSNALEGYNIKREDDRELLEIRIDTDVINNNIYLNPIPPKNRIFNRYDNPIEKRRFTMVEFEIDIDKSDYGTGKSNDDLPIIYFDNRLEDFNDNTPIKADSNNIINHLTTYKKKKVEYFYNRRSLSMNFKGEGIDATNEVILKMDNLRYKEVNMIPFFDYYNQGDGDKNINTNISLPNYGRSIYEIKKKKTTILLNKLKNLNKLNL